jgi:hypothetical protein
MEENREKFIFWTADGKIVPHLEYEFMESQGFGNYFPDDKERKNAEPFLVRVHSRFYKKLHSGCNCGIR